MISITFSVFDSVGFSLLICAIREFALIDQLVDVPGVRDHIQRVDHPHDNGVIELTQQECAISKQSDVIKEQEQEIGYDHTLDQTEQHTAETVE